MEVTSRIMSKFEFGSFRHPNPKFGFNFQMRTYHGRYVGKSKNYYANPWPQVLEQVVAWRNPIQKQVRDENLKGIQQNLQNKGKLLTRGGKIFSAARRGTEKPPWVLVSLAVNVLQKKSGWGLFVLSVRSDLNNASWSNCRRFRLSF